MLLSTGVRAAATVVALLAVTTGTGPAHAVDQGRIAGRVSSSVDADLSRVKVTAWTFTGGQVGGIAGEATASADGTYAVEGLGDGQYAVCFRDLDGRLVPECWDDATEVFTATPVVVAGGTAAPVDAELTAPGTISGTVTYDRSRPASLRVFAYPVDGSMASMAGVDYFTGKYTLPPLRPGSYVLHFQDWTGSVVNEWSGDALFRRNAAVVEVGAGESLTRDAELATAARIKGRISRVGRAPVAGEELVTAYRQDGATDTWDEIGELNLNGQDGTYTLGGLPAGTYKLRFGDGPGGYTVDEYWEDQPSLATATTLTLEAAGEKTGIDADTVATGHLYGSITLDGAVATGTLDLLRQDGGTWRVVETVPVGAGSQTGIFEGDVEPGTYRLRYTLDGRAAAVFHPGVASLESATDVVVGPGTASSIETRLTTAVPPAPTPSTAPAPAVTPSPTVAPAPVAPVALSGEVAVAGKPVVGGKLVARLSDVTPRSADASFQWYAGSKALKGSTKKSLKLSKAMAGQRISVRVTLAATGQRSVVVKSREVRVKRAKA